MIGCSCKQPLVGLAGMPVLLALKVTDKSGEIGNMTKAKMDRYHDALQESLLRTADHIYPEICATFQEEEEDAANYMYLSLLLMRGPLEAGFSRITTLRITLIHILSYHDLAFL